MVLQLVSFFSVFDDVMMIHINKHTKVEVVLLRCIHKTLVSTATFHTMCLYVYSPYTNDDLDLYGLTRVDVVFVPVILDIYRHKR